MWRWWERGGFVWGCGGGGGGGQTERIAILTERENTWRAILEIKSVVQGHPQLLLLI